eukprot:scaffold2227_cov143-Skeletonema_menzelii.AAC.1
MAIESFKWPIALGPDSREVHSFSSMKLYSYRQCYSLVANLMMPYMGGPLAPHIPSKSDESCAICTSRASSGPLYLARKVGKFISSAR